MAQFSFTIDIGIEFDVFDMPALDCVFLRGKTEDMCTTFAAVGSAIDSVAAVSIIATVASAGVAGC